jgi:hypothetical protein
MEERVVRGRGGPKEFKWESQENGNGGGRVSPIEDFFFENVKI